MSSRRIICKACSDKLGPQHPLDVADGWHRRVKIIKARKPEQHGITVYGGDSLDDLTKTKRIELSSLVCDQCGESIRNDSDCKAVTMWRGPEPEEWEHEYGEVL